jgi:hypothetical protein
MLAQYGECCMTQKNFLSLHDSACLHSVVATTEAIRQLKFEFSHPQYGPDLAASDYHMFGPLKKPCVNDDLASDEVKDTVHT